MRIDATTHRLLPSRYYAAKQEKSLIVLHFTAGTTARGAFASFASQKHRIATPYIIDRDGTIYEIFPPEGWAFALGLQQPRAVRDPIERRAIHIEIVNVGPLVQRGEQLNWWWPSNKFERKYCDLSEGDQYVRCPKWRGYQFFASYTPEQMEATAELTRYLCDRFSIPFTLPPEERRNTTDVQYFSRYRGICSHQNFRGDKSDVGPAFNWSHLQGVCGANGIRNG